MPLGGLGEIGKNMMVLEYEDDIIVIDAGVMFPEDDMPGIDLVIPDITYLKENKDRVKAIFLSHGHEDHIGAVPYVLQVLDAPIYGTRLTLGLLRGKLEEHGLSSSAELKEVRAGGRVSVGIFEVEFIHVNHSIADVVAIAVHTPLGCIIYCSDFKLDQTPIDGRVMDLHKFAELGQKGVLLLMSDSTNAERPGYTFLSGWWAGRLTSIRGGKGADTWLLLPRISTVFSRSSMLRQPITVRLVLLVAAW